MPRIILELLDHREIPKYLEGVADLDEEWALAEIQADADEWIAVADNGISINENRSERCLIKYELWDGPPPPLSSWDRSWAGSVSLTSGKVVAVSGYSGGTTYGEEFDLGREDTVWKIAIHRKSLGHEEFTPDIVGFTLLKLQFWPAAGMPGQ
ncbi:hypothetical protein ACIBG8_28230 [Nonomuraea sp. NPDC050556]|uniref:hypothetical protein n=1 Tax=Nonomuraea sp. NPDC050556 TaxID=3364369 RepID=UPI003791CA1F